MAKKDIQKMKVDEKSFQASEDQIAENSSLAAQEPMPKAPKSKTPIFKHAEVEKGAYRITAGMLKGLNATNPDWLVELKVADEVCYIISKEAYDKHM